MKALLSSVGSRGDVQPMAVLAGALRARGHDVRVAAPPNFRALVEDHGIEIVPIGADTHELIRENQRLAERAPLAALPAQIALLRRETERQIRDLLRCRDRFDVVVGAGLSFGARSLAERQQAAYAFVCYTLAGIRDDAHPPAAAPVFGLPRWGNRLLWAALTRSFDWALREPFDRARAAHGLGREPSPWRRVHAERTLLAQDPILGALPPGASAFCRQVPAIVAPVSSAALPADVQRFLAAPGPRVYVGFGSMPSVDRDRVVRAVAELQRATGARVLLYSAYAEELRADLPDGVQPVGALDHALLFPRVDLVVHHGGAGTTATALRAGVPQLVVPHIVDQFFHGRRVAELGLGPAPVVKRRLDGRALIDALRSSEARRARAREVGAELRAARGADEAADYVERLAAARPI